MGSKRTVILIAALVIGAVAAFSLYSYVNGIEDRAYKNADRVPVYVVAQTISANTGGQQVLNNKLIVTKQVPKEFMPPTALIDPSTIAAKFAKTDLVQGQIVVTDMFVDKQQVTSTWRDQLGADEVAIMVQLDSVKGMSGILQPGDQVTMLVQTDGTEGGVAATAAGSASAPVAGNNKMQFLYSNVEVMAIGSTGASATGSTAAGAAVAAATGPITFRVPLQAAEKIALIGSKLYLTLEPEGFVPSDADLAPLDWTGVFTGEKTPYKKTNKTDANAAPTTSTTVPAAKG